MQTQVISINPERISNPHPELPFDTQLFKTPEKLAPEQSLNGQLVQPSETRVRRALTIDGKLDGYVHTLNYALEIVRVRFSQVMYQQFDEKNTTDFQVKFQIDEENGRHICKLYRVSLGSIWDSRYKLCTVQIDRLPRLEIKPQTN